MSQDRQTYHLTSFNPTVFDSDHNLAEKRPVELVFFIRRMSSSEFRDKKLQRRELRERRLKQKEGQQREVRMCRKKYDIVIHQADLVRRGPASY